MSPPLLDFFGVLMASGPAIGHQLRSESGFFDAIQIFFAARILIYLVGMFLALCMIRKNPFSATVLCVVQFSVLFFMVYPSIHGFENLEPFTEVLNKFFGIINIALLGVPFLLVAVFIDRYHAKNHKIDSALPPEIPETKSRPPNLLPVIFSIFKKTSLTIGVIFSIVLSSWLFVFVLCSIF